MNQNAMSIFFNHKDFDHTATKMYGRMSANGNLLKGLIDHGRRDSLSVYVKNEEQYTQFKSMFMDTQKTSVKKINSLLFGDVPGLYQSGLYFTPDPLISKMAWTRSFAHPNAFSICGLTHTISNIQIAQEIGELIISPIQPWDAFICTSRAVKNAVSDIFRQWYSYLKTQKRFDFQSPIQLPIIPLGIHANEVASQTDKALFKKNFREKYNINENDFIVLFFGRLSFFEKAQPIPMFLALEELAHRTARKAKIHFLQASWFEHENDAELFKQSAKEYCPSINHIVISEEIDQAKKNEIFSVADVFISLVDNVQESFGLTPLEAMANELPVIVSDWDGYKDTVRHGIDGFRIPTYIAPGGCGADLGLGYVANALNHFMYCGSIAQMTAIDVDKTVDALWQLYQSPELRKTMGKNGRERIESTFDWQHIIKQYDELWDELTKIRLTTRQENRPNKYSIPLLSDPFQTFNSFATNILKPQDILSLNKNGKQNYTMLQKNELAAFGQQLLLPHSIILSLLDSLETKQTETADHLINFCVSLDNTQNSGIAARTLIYLVKYNILKLKIIETIPSAKK